MEIVTLYINDVEIFLPLDEFKSYIPNSIIEVYTSLISDRGFMENLMTSWNDYSPQSDEYHCFVSSINDESDLPYTALCKDIDICRLIFLKYCFSNFYSDEYTLISNAVKSKLVCSDLLPIYELTSIAAIDNQIKAKKEFGEKILSQAKQKYIEIIRSDANEQA